MPALCLCISFCLVGKFEHWQSLEIIPAEEFDPFALLSVQQNARLSRVSSASKVVNIGVLR